MPAVKIYNVDYGTDKFSDNGKALLLMLSVDDKETKRLKVHPAIAQTARKVYAQAMSQAVIAVPNGVTLKL